MSDFSYFDDFDGQVPETTQMADGLEKLKDGEYDVLVLKPSKRVSRDGEYHFLEMEFKVVDAFGLPDAEVAKLRGLKAKGSIGFKDKESFSKLMRHLQNAGFDTPQWTLANKRPASVELVKSIRWLKEMRLRIKKESFDMTKTGEDGRQSTRRLHGMHVLSRIKSGDKLVDGLPAVIGPEQLNQPDPSDPFPSA